MSFITKRRLASVASASALIATMAVASVPGAAFAATCQTTDFYRDDHYLTAAKIGGTVTGDVDADGCDIGVYNPVSVTNADIHGAKYMGVLVNGGPAVKVTGNKIHHIGDNPYGTGLNADNLPIAFDGMQRGWGVYYINGASGTISGNTVSLFQKNGIVVDGRDATATPSSTPTTSATVEKNVVTGRGPIGDIAQNGIVIRDGAKATVKNNTVSRVWYTGDDTATGLLGYNPGTISASANKFIDTEVAIDGVGTNPGGHVKP